MTARQDPGRREEQDPRGRYRAHVRQEVKDVALRQLAAGGPPAVSLNAIAKELGVSGPALYRYYRSRDDLLTDLVVDTYADLRLAVTEAATGHTDPADRVRTYARAFHRFALANPHRYRLLFTPPLPGYDANAAPLVAAAHALMSPLLDALAQHIDRVPAAAAGQRVPAKLAGQVEAWLGSRNDGGRGDARSGDAGSGNAGSGDAGRGDAGRGDAGHGNLGGGGVGRGLPPAIGVAALTAWSRLHGIVSLDVGGVYESMGIDAGALVDREVDALLSAFG